MLILAALYYFMFYQDELKFLLRSVDRSFQNSFLKKYRKVNIELQSAHDLYVSFHIQAISKATYTATTTLVADKLSIMML